MRALVAILTTAGPAVVCDFGPEPEARQSTIVAYRDGTLLGVSAGYAGFPERVRKILQRDFRRRMPAGPYLLAVESGGGDQDPERVRIDDGDSWQLGAFAAQALYAAGRLASTPEEAGEVLLLTGCLHLGKGAVESVAHIELKLDAARPLIKAQLAEGRRVGMVLPKGENARTARAALRGLDVVVDGVGDLAQLMARLGLDVISPLELLRRLIKSALRVGLEAGALLWRVLLKVGALLLRILDVIWRGARAGIILPALLGAGLGVVFIGPSIIEAARDTRAWFEGMLKAGDHVGSGPAHAREGDCDRAIRDDEETIRPDPNYAMACGLDYGNKGDHVRAERAFRKARELDPSLEAARDALAGLERSRKGAEQRCHRNINDPLPNQDDAIKACSRAPQTGGLGPAERAAILVARGVAYHRECEYDLAIRDYDEALKIHPAGPEYAWARYNRGLAYEMKKAHEPDRNPRCAVRDPGRIERPPRTGSGNVGRIRTDTP